MLGCPVFLDSSTLADLRELVSTGIAKSEMLVIMLSKGLLTRFVRNASSLTVRYASERLAFESQCRRPWCLLEISEAMRMRKPMILLELKGPGKGFSFEEAFAVLGDLETHLRTQHPTEFIELRAHTRQPLSKLQDSVRQALQMARARGVPHFNING
jgi:hypothetical protein